MRKELEAKLIAKALKDESFRNELRSGPKAAIEKELGMELPGEIDIRIVEENENEVCLVIPHGFSDTNELTDVELEAVAGGWTCTECGGFTSGVLCNQRTQNC